MERKLIHVFCLILLINLTTVFAFGSPGKRTYIGTYEEDYIAGDEGAEEEQVIGEIEVLKKEERAKEKPWEERFSGEESSLIYTPEETIAEEDSTGGGIEEDSTEESIEVKKDEINIISHDHIPLGGKYKMKEVEE